MNVISKIWDAGKGFFSSLRLAVFLLIILAAVSVLGTFIPQGQEPQVYIQKYGAANYENLKLLGAIDLYHSWGFRAITILIAMNLLVCSLRRFKSLLKRTLHPAAEKNGEAIRSLKIHNELPVSSSADVLESALAEKKYRVVKNGNFLYASKGKIGPWGDMITHASILLILLGGLVGSLGMVGTVNIYEGDYADQFYNWSTGKDEPLGFKLYVEQFTLQHYPVDLKVTVRDKTSGARVGTYKAKEGGYFYIPGTSLKIQPDKLDFDKQEALLDIYDGEYFMGSYSTGAPDGGPTAPPNLGFVFTLSSFSGPLLKNVASTVRIVKGGVEVDRAVIEINSPMKYGGMTIYQTSYARDPGGRYYSGFQFVKDPGLPLVWLGFVLIMTGLFCSFFLYHRQIWMCVEDGRIFIGGTANKDLPGFMREYSGIIKRFMQEVEPV